MIRAVVFDLGHTVWDIGPDTTGLLDAAYGTFRSRLQDELGRDDLPLADAMRSAVTVALAADAATYFTDGPELSQPPTHTWVSRALAALSVSVSDALVRELTPGLFATEVDRLVVGEGTLDAIGELHASGLRLGCVTNTLASQATIEEMLRRHGLSDLMQTVIVSAEEGVRKPHPRLFERALADVEATPAESVFVGDSPYHDIAAAKAVGMRAVQTTQYVSRPPVMGAPPPDATIAHLRELRALLEAW